MATRESIARRRDDATRRIADALAELHVRYDDAPALDLHPYHRDLDERNAVLLENIATGVDFMLARIVEAEQRAQAEAERAKAEDAEGESPTGESSDGEAEKSRARGKRR